MFGTRRMQGTPLRLLRPVKRVQTSQWRHLNHQWRLEHSLQAYSMRRAKPKNNQTITALRRWQSTDTSSAPIAAAGSRIAAYLYGTGLVVLLGFGYLYITDTRASIHRWLVVPALRILHHDPEEAHHAGIRYIKGLYDFNLHPRERASQDQDLGDLKIEVFGHVLDNPIGTSAGIDKNAEIPSALMALGPAVVEVGGATPHPQRGNDRPRVFRIPSQNALINRYGLNSEGAEHVAMQLRERLRQFAFDNGLGLDAAAERIVLDGGANVPPGSLVPGKLLAVQIAKNKTTPDSDIRAIVQDYVFCVEHLAKYADVLVVNVSSPNTPGLRNLQAAAPLTAILSSVVKAAKSCDRKEPPAVMVKVSPDEDSDAQIEGICGAVWASGVDGVIVGNTTKKRPDPAPRGYIMPEGESRLLTEVGGYSGPQLFERTLELVRRYRTKLDQGPLAGTAEHQSLKASESPSASNDRTTSTSLPPSVRSEQATTASQPPSMSSDLDQNPIESSVKRDLQRLNPLNPDPESQSKQPSIQAPEQPQSTPSAGAPSAPNSNPDATNSQANWESNRSDESPVGSKVIFATGGITNGAQCLQILNAGASVCQIYTAMMYGGVGTVTRMKAEMRESMRKSTAQSQ